MPRGYTYLETRTINAIRKAINRTRNILDKTDGRSEYAKDVAAMLKTEYGINIYQDYTNKELSQMDLSRRVKTGTDKFKEYTQEDAIRKLENTKTFAQLKREALKRLAEEDQQSPYTRLGNPRYTDEQIVNRIKEESDMHDFIEKNTGAIYEYEKDHGNIVSGQKNARPSWSELIRMRDEIETNPDKYHPIIAQPFRPYQEEIED